MAEIDQEAVDVLSQQALAALLDEEAEREFGEEAAFHILLTLGLFDGDVVIMAGPSKVHLRTSLDTIQARVAQAVELKNQGWPTHRIMVEGLASLRRREEAVARLVGATDSPPAVD